MLENRTEELETLQDNQTPTRVMLEPHSNPQHFQPDMGTVRFETTHGYIDVVRQRDGEAVKVFGSGPIIIKPQASNHFIISNIPY